MIIQKLILKDYKKFKEKTIEFGKGVNVIIGDNEVGKSTISQGLLDAMYSDPTTQSTKVLRQIQAWKSNVLPRLELEFEHEGSNFVLIKDFNTKEASLLNTDSKKKVSTIDEVNNVIGTITGLPSRVVYKNTAFISHLDVSKIEDDRDFMNALQNVANESQEDVNIQNVINNLSIEVKKLKLGMERHSDNPGPIRFAENEIKMLETEISTKAVIVQKVNESAKAGTSAVVKLKEVKERIDEITETLSNYNKYEKAKGRIDELDSQIKEIESKIVSYNELEAKKERIVADMSVYSQFKNQDSDKASAEISRFLEIRKMASAELNRMAAMDTKAEVTDIKALNKLWLFIPPIFVSVLLYFILNNILISLIFGVLLESIIFTLAFIRSNTGGKVVKKEIEIIKQNQDQWKFRIQGATSDLQAILDKFQCEDVSSFYTTKARFNLLNESAQQVDSEIRGLLSNTSIIEIKKKQIDLFTEKKQLETTEFNDKVKFGKITPQEYLMYERELDRSEMEEKKLEAELTTSKVRIGDSEIDSDYIVRLEEKLENTRQSLAFWKSKADVYELTQETIKQALKETAKTSSLIIEQAVSKDLPRITNGRYGNIKVDENFNVMVFSKEKEEYLDPVANFSTGTIDQIYFLLRIGFLKALVKNKMVPIICDDTFVTFDEDRRRGLKEVVKDLSDEFQFLLFTTDREYDEWGMVCKID